MASSTKRIFLILFSLNVNKSGESKKQLFHFLLATAIIDVIKSSLPKAEAGRDIVTPISSHRQLGIGSNLRTE